MRNCAPYDFFFRLFVSHVSVYVCVSIFLDATVPSCLHGTWQTVAGPSFVSKCCFLLVRIDIQTASFLNPHAPIGHPSSFLLPHLANLRHKNPLCNMNHGRHSSFSRFSLFRPLAMQPFARRIQTLTPLSSQII